MNKTENYICHYKDLDSDEGWNYVNEIQVMPTNMDDYREYKALQDKIDAKWLENPKFVLKPITIEKLTTLKQKFLINDGLTNLQRAKNRKEKEYQKEYQKSHFEKIKNDRQHCDCCDIEVLTYRWAKHIVTAKHRKNLGFDV
jgi:hypothetical protein